MSVTKTACLWLQVQQLKTELKVEHEVEQENAAVASKRQLHQSASCVTSPEQSRQLEKRMLLHASQLKSDICRAVTAAGL